MGGAGGVGGRVVDQPTNGHSALSLTGHPISLAGRAHRARPAGFLSRAADAARRSKLQALLFLRRPSGPFFSPAAGRRPRRRRPSCGARGHAGAQGEEEARARQGKARQKSRYLPNLTNVAFFFFFFLSRRRAEAKTPVAVGWMVG